LFRLGIHDTEAGVRTVRFDALLTVGGQLALVGYLTAAPGWGAVGMLTALTCLAATDLLLVRALRRSGAITLGPANAVTLVRATLAGAVAGFVAGAFAEHSHVVVLTAFASIALLLDLVDGPVARRTGTMSALGARFDMETDAFLIFVLSWYVAAAIGGWVLAIGFARYAFVVAYWLLPWLRAPVPPRYWRKTVAAIQGVVLTVAVADVLPIPFVTVASGIALVLLVESFAHDWWWLSQQHRAARTPMRRIPAAPVAVAAGRR
jgi:phosphatidylglycerophosphate synthase